MLPAIGRTDEEEEGQNGNRNSEQRETEEAGGNQLGETDEDRNDDYEEEEDMENLGSGNNVNHQNSEENESGNQESYDENHTSWLVVVEEEVEDDEEEERRRAAEKGKQPMSDEGGISITELHDEDDDHHLDLAILKAMCDYECIIRNSPQLSSFNNRLVYVKDSFPDLKMSRDALEEKIIALCKNFNDVREQLGDDPRMDRPIDREIFNLSMIIWGTKQMLGEGEAVPGNGGISSSNPDPPSPLKADSNSNLETELLCDESFSEIIEKEVVVVEEEVVSSDSLNERKRLRTDEEEDDATEDVSDSSKSRRIREEEAVSSDSLNERKRLHTDEEEDDATEAVSDSSKLRRIHEEGQKEIDEQKGNQDSEQGGNQESEVADEKDGRNEENDKKKEESEQNEGKEDGENEDKDEEEKETEGGNQENNNGEEEDKNEEDETEEVEKDDELPQFSTAEEAGEKHNLREYRKNVGGEDNVNRINSEQNEGNEDRDNGKKEEEEKETEEQKQKAVDKGKRPLFEESEEDEDEEEKQQAAKKWQKTSLVPITPNFSKFLQGESSRRTKTDQIQISTPKVDTELVDIQINYESPKDHDYHRDLNILIAMYDFKLNNGHLPYPHADELHNHIMDLMPDLNILGEDLTVKITAFEDDFNTALILDGDNPEMAQPIEREIFNLSKQLWGNSDDNVGDGI